MPEPIPAPPRDPEDALQRLYNARNQPFLSRARLALFSLGGRSPPGRRRGLAELQALSNSLQLASI